MAWGSTDVLNVAPEFASVPAAQMTAAIAAADLQISPTAFASARDPTTGLTTRDTAGVWLTAHFLAVSNPGLYKGLATSKRVGEVAVTYATPPPQAGVLSSTRFGAEYLRMASAIAGPGLSVL